MDLSIFPKVTAYVITDRKAKVTSKEIEKMRIAAGNDASWVLQISEKKADVTPFRNGDILFVERYQYAMKLHCMFKKQGRRNKMKIYTLRTKIKNVDTGKEKFHTWDYDSGAWDLEGKEGGDE